MSGIYQIRNIINNKIYIGSTVSFKNRWAVHLFLLNNNKHKNRHLQSSWNKYGSNNFVFEILEKVIRNVSESKQDFKMRLVYDREQHYFDLIKPYDSKIGYNSNKKADSNLGRIFSEDVRKKHRERWTKMKMDGFDFKKLGKKPVNYLSTDHKKRLLAGASAANSGAGNRSAKLTEEGVLSIRKLWSEGKYEQRELACMFTITQSQISRIINRKIWTRI